MRGQGSEKRRSKRYPFIEDVIVDGSKRCTSSDISEHGLYISAIQFFEKDRRIEVTIPFKGEKMVFKAEIKHSQPGIGVGVMFVDLSEQQKQKIKTLIEGLSGRDS